MLEHHWNQRYDNNSETERGWFEADQQQSLKFIQQMQLNAHSRVFIAGAGTSALALQLEQRVASLQLNDVSPKALTTLKSQLQHPESHTFIAQDISQPLAAETAQVDAWIDRAVVHVLLTEAEINAYFANLRQLIKPHGFVLLAEFSEGGAQRCAGLAIRPYSLKSYSQHLGTEFTLIAAEHYTFINPQGEPRPYVYGLYQRQG